MYSGLRLFKTAFVNTKRQICVSGVFLVAITFVLTVILYLAESRVDSDFSFWDAFIWPYEKYLGDPGKIVDEPVISPIAKIVGTLVGIMGVAIFAVPAGLIGSGLTDAMDEEKREQELAGFRRRLQKAFRRQSNKSLREYLNTLPDGGGEQFKTLNIVPQRVPIAKMQVRQGLDLKDIIDTCNKFEELRLKNLADAHSDEESTEDRFVVEHFPLNKKYGCFVPRQSKVTIVCTSSFDEVGIGWFTYYLAKFGGFNYISKEIEVDTDELDSYYNWSRDPLYDKKPISAYDKKKDKEAYETLEKKLENRKEFINDLHQSVQNGSWVIIFTEHLKNSVNQVDFHLAESLKDGSQSTISNQHQYTQFCDAFASMVKSEFGFETAVNSSRYPLLKKNLGYTIREKYPDSNVFVLRPSSELMNFDDRKLVIAYRMAQLISEQLDNSKGIDEKDIKDLKDTGFGYKEKREDNDKNK
jgi:voltage-gated potassium channel